MEFVCQLLQRIHVGTLAVEMNRKQRPKIVALGGTKKNFDTGGVEIKCLGIDIGKHRTRAGAYDGAGRSEETKRCGENQISGLHSGRGESEPQSISAGGAADGMGRATEVGKFALQCLDLGSQNVTLRSAYASHCCQHFGAHLLILPLQVEHRHGIELPRRSLVEGAWHGCQILAFLVDTEETSSSIRMCAKS